MKKKVLCILLALMLAMTGCAMAQSDPSPAVYVAQVTANSVVGIRASVETWTRDGGAVTTPMSQGSGVAVKDGGYVLTNYHVIEDCNVYEVLLSSGEYVKAELTGSDSTLDIAVLKIEEGLLTTCEIGSVNDLLVGSTVIAIGNPGGETLANTVTQGIVSALERNVEADNTQRAVSYIQHDAAISSGNSGGGLFDYRGRLVGINTLKYSGAYSSVSFEGLGFALPIDTVMPLVEQIIEYGRVIRPQIGVYTLDWEGPEEAIDTYPPASVLVAEVVEGAPAAQAGVRNYDFITHINGQRVKNYKELTTCLDKCEVGDTVTATIARYENIEEFLTYYYGGSGSTNSMFGYYYSAPRLGGYETFDVEIVLQILDN